MIFVVGTVTYHFDNLAEYTSALNWAQSSVTVTRIVENQPALNITFDIDTSRV